MVSLPSSACSMTTSVTELSAAEAEQLVVEEVAADEVGAGIAGAVGVVGVAEGEILDIAQLRQRIVGEVEEHGDDRIGAAALQLDDLVAGIVDDVGVVADAADQRVGAGAAIERVVAAVADQRVVLAA